jgi:hypothetical protein
MITQYMVVNLPNPSNPNLTLGPSMVYDTWIAAWAAVHEEAKKQSPDRVTPPKNGQPFRITLPAHTIELWVINRAELP